MFSMCSELTPRARILDTRIPQLMQPCTLVSPFMNKILKLDFELDFDIIENSDFEVW